MEPHEPATGSAAEAPVLVRRMAVGAIMVLTLHRPRRANAVDRAMTEALDAALDDLDDDPRVRVGILTGGRDVFSAGTDLQTGSGPGTPRGGEYGLIRRRRRTPLIAAVEGPAVGGGFEIVLSCDLLVAARDAWFSLPEVSRGLVASSGALFRLVQALPRNLALELLLTGRRLDAQEAAAHGLVNRLCDPGQAVEVAVELAGLIMDQSPHAVGATLTAVRRVLETTDDLGWAATEEALAAVLDSSDREEGVRAFLEKRPPRWSGR